VDAGIVDHNGKLLRDHANVGPPVLGKRPKKTRVLGKQTLQEIWNDMDRIILPSSESAAPRQAGSGKHGKLNADQWRTFCLVNLVHTLGRLWGSEPEGSRKRQMLRNFMFLAAATKLVNMRTTTNERAELFEYNMSEYLKGVLKLFPGAKIYPVQHLSLHLGMLLRQWGPVHAWRCFPFERWNYLLQKIPTNMKFGKCYGFEKFDLP
jgi:hypothetical protein